MLANGTTPLMPPIDGLAETRPGQPGRDRGDTVPRRLLVLGGGPIGVELAQAFRRLGLGSRGRRDDRLLSREEPFAGEQVAAASSRKASGCGPA